ncbi:MAG: glycosyltransferase [Blastocatellia bacterium]|nr:glycosyltransferase [Blastocatellia bacterium]
MSSTSGETSGRAMRVVHLVPTMFGAERGIVGGAERYAFELARFMARRVSTTLVSFGERDEQWDVDGLTVRVLGNTRYVEDSAQIRSASRFLEPLGGADVVHVHQQHIVASSVTAVLARLRRQKVFVSDLGGGGWDVSGYVSTDRWYHGHLHISEYSRQVFGHVSNPRAHVIYGGVDTDKFSPDASVPPHADGVIRRTIARTQGHRRSRRCDRRRTEPRGDRPSV